MSNRLSDRFKQGDESIMQMMARIQSEITTDSIADQWQSKLEEFGVVFSLSRSNHVENYAWKACCYYISKSVTTDSDAFLSLPVELNSEW